MPIWYFYALLGPAIWALLNHLDKYLLGRFFPENAAGPVLVVFTGFAGIIVAITILAFGPSVFTLAPWQAFSVTGAGALLVGSYVPYMIALQRDANLAVGFAGLMAPLALVSIVSGLHPLFLFVYGILFTLFFPAFSRERLTITTYCERLGRSVSCASE